MKWKIAGTTSPMELSTSKVEPRLAQQIEVNYDLPQTSIRLAFPGIDRDDPQSIAAYLMNHILGGGDFSSRLYAEVREKACALVLVGGEARCTATLAGRYAFAGHLAMAESEA